MLNPERKKEDYDVKMLRLFLRVGGYSKEEKNNILEGNPFDSKFTFFEKDMLNRIKNVGFAIKGKYYQLLCDRNYDIVEFGIDPKLSIATHFSGTIGKNVTFYECSIDENASKVMFRKNLDNKITLFYGLYDGMETLLKRLIANENLFIVGICVRPNEEKLLNDTLALYERLGCERVIQPVKIDGKNLGYVLVVSNVNRIYSNGNKEQYVYIHGNLKR